MKNSKLLLNCILFFSLIISSISCDRNHAPVFEKYLKFKNASWDRFDIKHFEIPFDETTKTSDITIVIHCTEKFKYNALPLYVVLTAPSGEESIREISVKIRENGKLISEPQGIKSESRLVLWKSINSSNGNYKISIENLVPIIQTEGIEEIGILVTESV